MTVILHVGAYSTAVACLLASAHDVHEPGDIECLADRRGERVISAYEAMELIVEHIADGRLQRESFFLGSGGVRPLDLFGHLQPGGPSFGENLKAGRRQEPARVSPRCTVIAAIRDLGRPRPPGNVATKLSKSASSSTCSRRGNDLASKALKRLWMRLKEVAAPVNQIAARIDRERGWRDLGGRAGNGVTIETIESGLPHHEARRAQLRSPAIP